MYILHTTYYIVGKRTIQKEKNHKHDKKQRIHKQKNSFKKTTICASKRNTQQLKPTHLNVSKTNNNFALQNSKRESRKGRKK